MSKRTTRWATALITLACVSLLQAHHSNSMYDMSTYIWLKGSVVSYEAISPHAMIELEVRAEDGQLRRWSVQGPNPGRLNRLDVADDFLKKGDVIEVCGFFSKTDVSRNNHVHGHVLIMPDGKTWQWGPYGRLESCVNQDDWDSIERGTNPLRVN